MAFFRTVMTNLLPLLLLSFLFFFILPFSSVSSASALKFNDSLLAGIEIPDHLSFNSVVSSTTNAPGGCHLRSSKTTSSTTTTLKSSSHHHQQQDSAVPRRSETVKLNLKHRSEINQETSTGKKESVLKSTRSDLARIQTLHRRITENKNQNALGRLTQANQKNDNRKNKDKNKKIDEQKQEQPGTSQKQQQQLMATLASGVSLGSGEYLIDVFVGTPPKHFPVILDTGSDLNWLQCLPCYDCFDQKGPHYNPTQSSSFRNITCKDPRCHLVSSPDPPQPCKSDTQNCPYFYWYGDRSNTTGDFALETFTVNLTSSSASGKSEFKKVENVMFGCGHWNRGLFHGASGLLGLGRGPLSFSSQLQSLYGHSFSYCLVDRNSDFNVSSKFIFGEDEGLMKHPELKFTSFVGGNENPLDTFYYVQVKGVKVGGELLKIPEETWKLSATDRTGGMIIDSGTTLSYFADPGYEMIKEAFIKKIKGYPVVDDFPVLNPCYNVSGVGKLEIPGFEILFEDGAVWKFPLENYFIKLEPEEIICLAILGTPKSSLSILGNYQQQNFHIMYDTRNSRLAYAPMKCADI